MSENDRALFELGSEHIFISDLVDAIIENNLDLVNTIINKSKPIIRQDKVDVIGKDNLFKVNEGEIHERNGSYIQGYRRGIYDLAQSISFAMMKRKHLESDLRCVFKIPFAKLILDYLSTHITATRAEIMSELETIDKLRVMDALMALESHNLIDIFRANGVITRCSIVHPVYVFAKTQRYNDIYEEVTRKERIEKAIRNLKSALIE